jgi:hypothetical protein
MLPLVMTLISTVAISLNNKDNNVSHQSQYRCNKLRTNVR